MDSHPFVHPEHSNAQATKQRTITPPTESSAGMASMFSNMQNSYITGGSFTNIATSNKIYSTKGPSALDALRQRAAPNAILNAGGRADEVKCHPGTRKEVLGRIKEWRDAQDSLTPPIFWLSGPAGAGKTAIVQTFAKHCKARGVPQANFFFFRTDPSRNSLDPLVATLLHQIILLYPSVRDPVATVLSTNPLILDSFLEDQLMQLIVAPLQAIRQSSLSYRPLLLLIDGLDECESENKSRQRQILHVFDKILLIQSCPFRLLVASRDESQIQAAFNEISSQLLPLHLDDQYSPERDIRAFVNDEFKRVRMTHPLARTLDASWPSVQDVEDIVNKSSGQFIYAATVMRFITDSSASPMLSLARVQGAAQISTRSPFSYLDAIYTYILSQVDDQKALKDILHAQLLIQGALQSRFVSTLTCSSPNLELLAVLLKVYDPEYTQTRICSCLADLTPIARYASSDRLSIDRFGVDHKLLFHHASFPDYLLDHSRSRDYFVDIDAFNMKIQPVIWKGLELLDLGLESIAYLGLWRLNQLPTRLLNIMITLSPSRFGMMANHTDALRNLFQYIYNLCTCDDDVTNYKRILRQWIYTFGGMPLPQEVNSSKWPPYSYRYLAMAHIEYRVTAGPCGRVGIALCPETDFDARETVVWLNNLLHCIHREIHHKSVREYNQLIQAWMSWATWNDIPLKGVDDLPNTWWYLRRSRIEKWLANCFGRASRNWQ